MKLGRQILEVGGLLPKWIQRVPLTSKAPLRTGLRIARLARLPILTPLVKPNRIWRYETMTDSGFFDASRPSRKRTGESADQPILLVDNDEEEIIKPASKQQRAEQPLPDSINLGDSDEENLFGGVSHWRSSKRRQNGSDTQQQGGLGTAPKLSVSERVEAMIPEWTKDLPPYSKKYYVALKAREPGIFAKWRDCAAQTKGVAGWSGRTVYRTCSGLEEAKAFARKNLPNVLREQDIKKQQVKDEQDQRSQIATQFPRSGLPAPNSTRTTSNGQSNVEQHKHDNDGRVYAQNGGANTTQTISPGGPSAPNDEGVPIRPDGHNADEANGYIDFDVADKDPALCKEQQEAVDYALSGRNVFMTGSGGCGKSVVVRHLLKKFRSKGKNVSIVAPTGIAAFQVSGATTCAFMGWTQDTCKEPFKNVKVNLWKKMTAARLMSTDVLIIDEISMVSNFHFDRMSRAFTEIKQIRKHARLGPFGGCQVIAVGDFCQLPPINGLEFCNECGQKMTRVLGRDTTYTCPSCPRPITYHEEDKWAFKSEAWADCKFANVHLTKIHRQSDDSFVKVLQKGRLGQKLAQTEIDLLLNHPCNIDSAVWLSSRRKEVNDRNDSEFAKLKSEQFNYWCIDKFDCAHEDLRGTVQPVYWGGPPQERRPLDKLSDHRYSNCLSLKIGMPVILLKNVDVQRGLCNGSQGVIVGFQYYKKAPCPLPPNKDNYRDDPEGFRRALRRWNESGMFMTHPGLDHQVLPVVQFNSGVRHIVQADCTISQLSAAEGRFSLLIRTQIPLAPGWALTIHKSQGMTLERLVVNLASVFEHGQAYVALSRATALEGLKIEGGNAALTCLRTKLGPPQEVMGFLREKFPHMFQG